MKISQKKISYISDTYVEGYFPLPLDVVKHIVQSWQELHVLVQLPSEFLINLQILWSDDEAKRILFGYFWKHSIVQRFSSTIEETKCGDLLGITQD